jgi:hypothetical protein
VSVPPYPTDPPCPLCGKRRCLDWWKVLVQLDAAMPGRHILQRAELWDDGELYRTTGVVVAPAA